MPGIEISALPAAPSAQLTDVFPIDQLPGPVTYKLENSQLLTLFKTQGEALTRTNDTNVTLTLGGSPLTALFNATSMTLGWTGVLSGTRGGTGVNNGARTITIGGNYQMTGAFTFNGTLTGNTAVTFPTSGTLATTSQIVTWNGVAGTTQAAAAYNAYVIQNAALTTVTLPSTAAIGSPVRVQGFGAGGWVLAANAGQTIQVGSSATTVAGSVSSVNRFDCIEVVCIVANTTWAMSPNVSAGFTIA